MSDKNHKHYYIYGSDTQDGLCAEFTKQSAETLKACEENNTLVQCQCVRCQVAAITNPTEVQWIKPPATNPPNNLGKTS